MEAPDTQLVVFLSQNKQLYAGPSQVDLYKIGGKDPILVNVGIMLVHVDVWGSDGDFFLKKQNKNNRFICLITHTLM